MNRNIYYYNYVFVLLTIYINQHTEFKVTICILGLYRNKQRISNIFFWTTLRIRNLFVVPFNI